MINYECNVYMYMCVIHMDTKYYIIILKRDLSLVYKIIYNSK